VPVERTGIGRGRKMPKILLVEDNEMNQDMLSRPMVRRGYEACFLRMAPKGWRRRQLRPDLVLIDMRPAGLERLEGDPRLKSAPET
jgi:CheY-like chemotaxis protein